MIRFWICGLVAFLMGNLLADPAPKYTGNWLMNCIEDHQRFEAHRKISDQEYGDMTEMCGYLVGVSMAGNGRLWNQPAQISVKQISLITLRYMNAHPEQWTDPANLIIERALKQAFSAK